MASDRRGDSTRTGTLAGIRSPLWQWWVEVDRGWQATLLGVLTVAAVALL